MPRRDGELSGLMGGEDVGGREAELKLPRVAANLLESGVDERERADGGLVGGVLARIDPGSKELGGEVALARGGEVDHAAVQGRSEVPRFVEEALRGVGVGVDDDG